MSARARAALAGGPPAPAPIDRWVARQCPPGTHDALVRLRRAEGQVRGIERMIEAGQPCSAVVVQIAAATRALQEVTIRLLCERVRQCRSGAGPGPADDDAVDEVARSLRLVVRR